jgi:hypothetical protein
MWVLIGVAAFLLSSPVWVSLLFGAALPLLLAIWFCFAFVGWLLFIFRSPINWVLDRTERYWDPDWKETP